MIIEVRAGTVFRCCDCGLINWTSTWCEGCHAGGLGWSEPLDFTRVGVPAGDAYIVLDPDYGTITWF